MNNKKLNDEDNEVIEHYDELNNKEIGGISISIGVFLCVIASIILYSIKNNHIKIELRKKDKDPIVVFFIVLIILILCSIITAIYFFSQ